MESVEENIDFNDTNNLTKLVQKSSVSNKSSPLGISRYGRTRKPKISQDFCSIDDAIDEKDDVVSSESFKSPPKQFTRPKHVQASATSCLQTIKKDQTAKVKSRPSFNNNAEIVHITGDSQPTFNNNAEILHITGDSDIDYPCNVQKSPEIIKNEKHFKKPVEIIKPVIKNISFTKEKIPEIKDKKLSEELKPILSEEIFQNPPIDVSEVFKIISNKSNDFDLEMTIKHNPKGVLKTYSNKRKSFQKRSSLIESFGLPDEPIVPVGDKSPVKPLRISEIDVEVVKPESVNLVDRELIDSLWKINSNESDYIYHNNDDIIINTPIFDVRSRYSSRENIFDENNHKPNLNRSVVPEHRNEVKIICLGKNYAADKKNQNDNKILKSCTDENIITYSPFKMKCSESKNEKSILNKKIDSTGISISNHLEKSEKKIKTNLTAKIISVSPVKKQQDINKNQTTIYRKIAPPSPQNDLRLKDTPVPKKRICNLVYDRSTQNTPVILSERKIVEIGDLEEQIKVTLIEKSTQDVISKADTNTIKDLSANINIDKIKDQINSRFEKIQKSWIEKEKIREEIKEHIKEEIKEQRKEEIKEHEKEEIKEQRTEEIKDTKKHVTKERRKSEMKEKRKEYIREKNKDEIHEQKKDEIKEKKKEETKGEKHDEIREKKKDEIREKKKDEIREKKKDEIKEKKTEEINEKKKDEIKEKKKDAINEKKQDEIKEKQKDVIKDKKKDAIKLKKKDGIKEKIEEEIITVHVPQETNEIKKNTPEIPTTGNSVKTTPKVMICKMTPETIAKETTKVPPNVTVKENEEVTSQESELETEKIDEKTIEEPITETKPTQIENTSFGLGHLMWAKIGGYPYWPCVITKDPSSKEFKKFRMHNKMFHVRFFGDNGRRSWISRKNLLPYDTDLYEMQERYKNRMIVPQKNARSYKHWKIGVEEAYNLKDKSLKEKFAYFAELFGKPRIRKLSSKNDSYLSSSVTCLEIKSPTPKISVTSVETKSQTSKNFDKRISIRKRIKSILSLSTSREDVLKKLTKEHKYKRTTRSSLHRRKSTKSIKSNSTSNDSKNESEDLDDSKTLDTSSSFSEDEILFKKFVPLTLESQAALYRRNNLFKGVARERFCQLCEKSGVVLKCKGRCNGYYHVACATKKELINVNEIYPHEYISVDMDEIQLNSMMEDDAEDKLKINKVKDEDVVIIEDSPPRRRRTRSFVSKELKSKLMADESNDKDDATVKDAANETEIIDKSSPSKLRNKSVGNVELENGTKDKGKDNVVIIDDNETLVRKLRRKTRSFYKEINLIDENTDDKNTEDACKNKGSSKPEEEVLEIKEEDDKSENVTENPDDQLNDKTTDQDDGKKQQKGSKDCHVKIVNIRNRKKPANFPKLSLNKDGDFLKLPLFDQIDHKMKEVMQKIERKLPTVDSTTDYTSSEESALYLRSPTTKNITENSSPPIKNELDDAIKPSMHDDIINGDENSQNKGSTKNELLNETDFKCSECLNDIDLLCFVCHKETTRHGSDIRQKCSIFSCGKFYHAGCLKVWPQTQWSVTNTTKHKQSNTNVDTFVCPVHVCHTCVSDDPRAAIPRCTSDKVVRCLRCPATYHSSAHCIPAGTEILSSTQIICPRHLIPQRVSKRALPIINTTWCVICSEGGALICCEMCPTSVHTDCLEINLTEDDNFICEDCETGRFPLYDEIVWVKLGHYKWWPAVILFPNEVPDNIKFMKHGRGEFVVRFFGTYNYHWIGRGRVFLFQEGDSGESSKKKERRIVEVFRKSIEEATRAYLLKKEFKRNINKEAAAKWKPPPYIRIKVNRPVGNVRQFDGNISNTTSCECDPKMENPCGADSDCLNRLLLTECNTEVCPAGDKCQNQNFEKRKYPPLVPYKTESRGWGLKSLEPLKKGQFVIEYVGEMIDEQEYQRRIKKMHEQKEENYYFLTIEKDRMLDAGPKGNVARFMNHSCQPNCETQKWTVNGDTRVGLFSVAEVPANTELTFNYNLECVGKEKKICKCGAPNCSGFIGVKAKQGEKKLKPKLKYKKKKRSPKPEPESKEPCFICGENGEVSPCNNKICTKYYHLKCVNLATWSDNKWVCPWHNCNICSKRTIRCCVKCVNSYCPVHSDGNVRYDKLLGFVCSGHDPNKVNSEEVTIDDRKNRDPTTVEVTEEHDVTSTTSDELEPTILHPTKELEPSSPKKLIEHQDIVTSTPIKSSVSMDVTEENNTPDTNPDVPIRRKRGRPRKEKKIYVGVKRGRPRKEIKNNICGRPRGRPRKDKRNIFGVKRIQSAISTKVIKENDTPKAENNTSNVENNTPNVKDNTPNVKNNTANAENNTPDVPIRRKRGRPRKSEVAIQPNAKKIKLSEEETTKALSTSIGDKSDNEDSYTRSLRTTKYVNYSGVSEKVITGQKRNDSDLPIRKRLIARCDDVK